MKKILFIAATLVILLTLTSSPLAAKPEIPSETSEGEYNYTDSGFINGCYYNLSRVWVDFSGVCYWTCTEFEDGSVRQSTIIYGEADIYDYIGTLTLLEDGVPFYINEDFLDSDGTKTEKTTEGYYNIIASWYELDEYYYHREIEGQYEQEYRLKKNDKWSWWYKAGKCSERAKSNNYDK